MADHARLAAQQKLDLLDQLEAGLLGRHDDIPEAVTLRLALSERGLAPRHAQDLLTAFRMDVTKLRYHDWDDLMHYCSYSAMPVGRFVLDVHGEDRSTWPANDALCAALQIINHLQDCRKDYRELDRVYVPLDALAEHQPGHDGDHDHLQVGEHCGQSRAEPPPATPRPAAAAPRAIPITVGRAETRRVQRAKTLVSETGLPMSSIAFAAGFGSIRRFNAAFRAVYRRPPSALRRRARRAVESRPRR